MPNVAVSDFLSLLHFPFIPQFMSSDFNLRHWFELGTITFVVFRSVSWVVIRQIILQYLFSPPSLEVAHKHLVRKHTFLQLKMDRVSIPARTRTMWSEGMSANSGPYILTGKLLVLCSEWGCGTSEWASSTWMRTVFRRRWVWHRRRNCSAWLTTQMSCAEPLTSEPLDKRKISFILLCHYISGYLWKSGNWVIFSFASIIFS